MARVLSRYFEPKEIKDVRNDKDLQNLARKVTNVKYAKKVNWAILDFAAKVCKTKKPDCQHCPLKENCKYYNQANNNKNSFEHVNEPQFNLYFDKYKNMEDPRRPLKLISLFSGCGGMDIGFEGGFQAHKKSINTYHHPEFIDKEIDSKYVSLKPTKFETVFANDILKPARDAWVNYFTKKGYSPEIFRLESIVELVKLHQQGIKVFPEHVDIVTGGFPCQDFSVSGKRSGFNSNKDHQGKLIKKTIPSIETRGKLYMWMKNVIDIVKPKIFVAENVKGLVNLENVKEVIQQDFASAYEDGYIVLPPKVLHAANYGVPQSRERVFFIGLKKSELRPGILEELQKKNIDKELSPYPEPTHNFNNHLNGFIEPVKLYDIFKDLVEPEVTSDPSHMYYSKAKYMGKHCQGQIEINLNKIGPTIRAEHHGNIEFRRLSIENGGQNFEEINKGLIERRLTPRECALIQSFPPDFDCVLPSSGKKFIVSPSSAYKLIGNAVPPLLAYHLAKRLEKLWRIYFKEYNLW
jgi:DNA (cytosine-5)-methyltransferase 1